MSYHADGRRWMDGPTRAKNAGAVPLGVPVRASSAATGAGCAEHLKRQTGAPVDFPINALVQESRLGGSDRGRNGHLRGVGQTRSARSQTCRPCVHPRRQEDQQRSRWGARQENGMEGAPAGSREGMGGGSMEKRADAAVSPVSLSSSRSQGRALTLTAGAAADLANTTGGWVDAMRRLCRSQSARAAIP